jgi:hypothetical protein
MGSGINARMQIIRLVPVRLHCWMRLGISKIDGTPATRHELDFEE